MKRKRKPSANKQRQLKDLNRRTETSNKEIESVNGATDVTVTTRGDSIILTQGKASSLRK